MNVGSGSRGAASEMFLKYERPGWGKKKRRALAVEKAMAVGFLVLVTVMSVMDSQASAFSFSCSVTGSSRRVVLSPRSHSLTMTTSSNERTVLVFDAAVPQSICAQVDKAAQCIGGGHVLFDRSCPPSSPLEQIIEHCLSRIQDPERYAEYWWRDEWMSLDAHRDADEVLARTQRKLRWPAHGHVLYLHVGQEVRGPTLLFDDGGGTVQEMDKLYVVPARTGRLLRFQGDRMHAVPRPTLSYLDPSEGGSNDVLWTRRRKKSDGTCDESTIYRRSVLLFNTWASPPLNVPLLKHTLAENPALAAAASLLPEIDLAEIESARLGDGTWRAVRFAGEEEASLAGDLGGDLAGDLTVRLKVCGRVFHMYTSG